MKIHDAIEIYTKSIKKHNEEVKDKYKKNV